MEGGTDDQVYTLLGQYEGKIQLATLAGANADATVTVQGTARFVTEVLSAAMSAFQEEAER